MRSVLGVLLLASCGRIAFDPQRTGDGGAGDDAITNDARSDTPTGAGTAYLVSSDGVNPTQIFTVELATGQLTLVGSFAPGIGVIGGLAYWDATTLYGTTQNALVRITLTPSFNASVVNTMPGTWSAIERDGNLIFGVDQDGDAFGTFDPAAPAGVSTSAIGFDAIGGDVYQVGGVWLYFANTGQQLYELTAGTVTARGAPSVGAPFIAGMVQDSDGQLFVHSGDTNELYPIDPTTGQLGAAIQLCLICPTPYDLQSGDMTRAP